MSSTHTMLLNYDGNRFNVGVIQNSISILHPTSSTAKGRRKFWLCCSMAWTCQQFINNPTIDSCSRLAALPLFAHSLTVMACGKGDLFINYVKQTRAIEVSAITQLTISWLNYSANYIQSGCLLNVALIELFFALGSAWRITQLTSFAFEFNELTGQNTVSI